MTEPRFSVDSVYHLDNEVLMQWYQVIDEEMGGGIALFQFESDANAWAEFMESRS
jgi:hypothetical protein